MRNAAIPPVFRLFEQVVRSVRLLRVWTDPEVILLWEVPIPGPSRYGEMIGEQTGQGDLGGADLVPLGRDRAIDVEDDAPGVEGLPIARAERHATAALYAPDAQVQTVTAEQALEQTVALDVGERALDAARLVRREVARAFAPLLLDRLAACVLGGRGQRKHRCQRDHDRDEADTHRISLACLDPRNPSRAVRDRMTGRKR